MNSPATSVTKATSTRRTSSRQSLRRSTTARSSITRISLPTATTKSVSCWVTEPHGGASAPLPPSPNQGTNHEHHHRHPPPRPRHRPRRGLRDRWPCHQPRHRRRCARQARRRGASAASCGGGRKRDRGHAEPAPRTAGAGTHGRSGAAAPRRPLHLPGGRGSRWGLRPPFLSPRLTQPPTHKTTKAPALVVFSFSLRILLANCHARALARVTVVKCFSGDFPTILLWFLSAFLAVPPCVPPDPC